MKRSKLIILGTGFSSFSLVKDIDTELSEVVIVSPRNHFLFTPLLPSTTVGTIEFRSIIEPVRTARTNIQFYQAACTGVDPERQIIHCEGALDKNPFQLEYDRLVIAVGAVSNTYGIPGVLEHALFLKELADARAIRQRIIECFERASTPGLSEEERRRLLHFVVVGGGPTGVEFAAEMHDFLTEDLHKWFPQLANEVRITLLEAMKQILGSFDTRLSGYAMKIFQRQRIEIRTGSPVREVKETTVILHDGTEIPFGLVVWSTGLGPTSLVHSLRFPKDKASRLITDEHFCVKNTRNIYAMGDCATIEGQNLPATAQVAQQQGRYLARTLNRMAKGKPLKPFRYHHMGMLAYIGSKRALADLPGVKGRGFSAWLFWRSAYLTRLVSLKNKILVLFDWFKTSIFGRDISRF